MITIVLRLVGLLMAIEIFGRYTKLSQYKSPSAKVIEKIAEFTEELSKQMKESMSNLNKEKESDKGA